MTIIETKFKNYIASGTTRASVMQDFIAETVHDGRKVVARKVGRGRRV